MKAVQAQADGSVSVVEIPVPPIGPGEALFEPRVAGICGSDLLGWYVRRKSGSVLGHEIAGRIVSVGETVERFAAGDRAVPHHHAPCMACDACAAGRYVHCAVWRTSRLDPGGMAEYVRIPGGNLAADTLAIPEGVSDEEACFTEPLATVVKAFRRARFQSGQSILVVGLGATGQLAVRLARSLGAARITGADPIRSRAAAALESGAEDALEISAGGDEDLARRAGRRRFDVVFVCPGRVEVIRTCLDVVAPGGTLLLFTMASPDEVWSVSPHDLYFREILVVPSYSCGPDDTRQALDLIASRRLRVADLVTHRFRIERARDAFERARDPNGSIKVVITFERT